MQLTPPSIKCARGAQQVHGRHAASAQVFGHTGAHRWARHPHHVKSGVHRGHTAQKACRCVQVSNLIKGGVHAGGHAGCAATPLKIMC